MKHQEATYVSDKNISLAQNFNSPYVYGGNIVTRLCMDS